MRLSSHYKLRHLPRVGGNFDDTKPLGEAIKYLTLSLRNEP
jgi:hypothetical protein